MPSKCRTCEVINPVTFTTARFVLILRIRKIPSHFERKNLISRGKRAPCEVIFNDTVVEVDPRRSRRRGRNYPEVLKKRSELM